MFHHMSIYRYVSRYACVLLWTLYGTICFTICLFISPDLDGHRAPKMKYCPRDPQMALLSMGKRVQKITLLSIVKPKHFRILECRRSVLDFVTCIFQALGSGGGGCVEGELKPTGREKGCKDAGRGEQPCAARGSRGVCPRALKWAWAFADHMHHGRRGRQGAGYADGAAREQLDGQGQCNTSSPCCGERIMLST